ncbi:MAG TPA: hypothetical protein VFW66_13490 [Gemmatimonadales bacterium]|nr:hypothetical protein [Gemmatimonadales bacterium]
MSTQEEVDDFWEKLSEGGEQGPKRVMEAMLKMKNIDIAGLRRAFDQA